MPKPAPIYIKCTVCDKPLGRRGDSPMVKAGDKLYRHQDCKLR